MINIVFLLLVVFLSATCTHAFVPSCFTQLGPSRQAKRQCTSLTPSMSQSPMQGEDLEEAVFLEGDEDADIDLSDIRRKLLAQAPGMEGADDPFEALEEDPEKITALADKMRNAMVGNLVENIDINELMDTEFDKGKQELMGLAEELKGGQGTAADTLAESFREAFQEETDKLLAEKTELAETIMKTMNQETKILEREMENMKSLQDAMAKDPLLQVQTFPQKGPIKQAAFVAAILIANQAVYQVLLVVEGRGGNAWTAALEVSKTNPSLACALNLLTYYHHFSWYRSFLLVVCYTFTA
ncbi:unnamed protein product [Chrysoparadoxa australica]